jgi:hypothetical protein
MAMPGADSPDLAAAKRLLDTAKSQGFTFQRIAPGPDGPLVGVRETVEYRDTCYLGGFGDGCCATRARKYSLIVPGGLPITERVTGDALTVLRTVVADWLPT